MKLFDQRDDGSVYIPATVEVCTQERQEAQDARAERAEQADSEEGRLAWHFPGLAQ